jgi:hypothetical protein
MVNAPPVADAPVDPGAPAPPQGPAPRPWRWERIRRLLPAGGVLPDDLAAERHRGLVALLWVHVVGLYVFALIRGDEVVEAAFGPALLAAVAAVASWRALALRWRAVAATVGLLMSSTVLVHLADGVTEAHFHFFVMVSLITLYQSWLPFAVAALYVVGHHGLLGAVRPESVYHDASAIAQPWKWAILHIAFLFGASFANLYAWRKNEESARALTETRLTLEADSARRRHALELNDDVIQGLVVVKMAMELDDRAQAAAVLDRTIDAAQAIVVDLLSEQGPPGAGSLERHLPPSAPARRIQ